MNIFIKKLVNLIFFTGIVSFFLPDKLSKSLYNCIIICFAVITLLETIQGLNFKFSPFNINNRINEYYEQCKSFGDKYNVFFENIKNTGDVNEN